MSFDPFDGPLDKDDVELLAAYELSDEYARNKQVRKRGNSPPSKNSGCCGVFIVVLFVLLLCVLV